VKFVDGALFLSDNYLPCDVCTEDNLDGIVHEHGFFQLERFSVFHHAWTGDIAKVEVRRQDGEQHTRVVD